MNMENAVLWLVNWQMVVLDTNVRVQSSTVLSCFVLEQDTLSALLLSIELNIEHRIEAPSWRAFV